MSPLTGVGDIIAMVSSKKESIVRIVQNFSSVELDYSANKALYNSEFRAPQ